MLRSGHVGLCTLKVDTETHYNVLQTLPADSLRVCSSIALSRSLFAVCVHGLRVKGWNGDGDGDRAMAIYWTESSWEK